MVILKWFISFLLFVLSYVFFMLFFVIERVLGLVVCDCSGSCKVILLIGIVCVDFLGRKWEDMMKIYNDVWGVFIFFCLLFYVCGRVDLKYNYL